MQTLQAIINFAYMQSICIMHFLAQLLILATPIVH